MHTEYRNIVYMSPFSDLILHISISFYTIQDHFTDLFIYTCFFLMKHVYMFHLYMFLSMFLSIHISFIHVFKYGF